MAIEFDCPTCRKRIRTPDGSEGKPARCPGCGAISAIPAQPSETAAASPSIQASIAPATVNPFGERPEAGGVNPYAAPAEIYQPQWQAQLSAERARARLLGPAIGLLLFAVTGLGFMAMVGVGVAAEGEKIFEKAGDDAAQRAGAKGFFVAYFTVGLLTRVVQILGAIAMFRVRSYSLAMAGAICALIPCDVYCCVPCLPFGVWGLIVLNNAAVKAAFR